MKFNNDNEQINNIMEINTSHFISLHLIKVNLNYMLITQ